MADLTSSNVTLVESWREGDFTGKLRVLCRRVRLVGTFGGTTNRILASALGFLEIESVSIKSNTWLPAAPSFDGKQIFTYNPNQATDASRNAPADFTFSAANAELIIKGKELNVG